MWTLAALTLWISPAAALEVEDPNAGRYTELTMVSVEHGAVELLIYTPPGYFMAGNQDRYPVVYWLHGSGGDHLSLKVPLESLPTPGFDGVEKLDALIESDPNVEPLIMVGIGAPTGSWGASSTDLVTVEVPRFVDLQFRTVARRGGRGLEGFSLGSEGVSRYVTARPDVFATASLLGGGFLPATWTASEGAVLRDKLEVAQFVGDQDSFQTDALILATELDTLGIPNELNVLGGVGHSTSQLYGTGGAQILAFHTDRWRRARVVDAGPDQTLDAGFPVMTTLAGAIDDSGGSLGTFTTVWEQVSGPGAAAFADDAALPTQVTLPEPGTYHFRLLAQGDVDRCDVVRVVAVDTGAGLELHLTFDAGDGADASGNGRDGTLSGGPSALADGRVGGGLSFDGQDDAVIVPDFDYGDEWTVALWMRADDLTGVGYQYVASHNGFDLQPSFNFYLPETAATLMEDPGDLLSPQQPQAPAVNGFTGRARAAVRDGNDGPGQFSTASAPVDDGGWHHLILTVPAGGGHRVVVDGLDLAGGSHGGAAFDPPGDLFFGGRSVAPAGRYFDGDLDEIRLYSRGLLDEEVAMLSSEDDANAVPFVDAGDDLSIYQPGGAVVEGVAVDDGPLTLEWSQVDGPGLAAFAEPGSAVSGVTFDQVGAYTLRLTVDDGTTEVSDDVDVAVLTESEPGLVGRWAFSASGGAVAFDTSGLAQDGQLTGTPAAPTWTLGQRGNALHFDGTQNQAVIIPGSPLLDPRPQRDDFSILLWLRVDPGAEGSIISRGSSEVSARQFQIFLLDPNNDGVSDLTAVVGGLTNDQPKQLGERVDDGRWRHVALVHDAMALTNQFFIDGVAIGAAVPSGTATQDLSLLIGARRVDADDTGIGFPLTGAVDDVRFYTRALTAQDIQDVLSEPFCTDADCIFGDGFESGDVSAWDSCFGDCL